MCVGSATLEASCMEQECPVDCLWSEWADWEGCSQSCDGGQRSRYRSVAQVKNAAGAECSPPSSQTESCGMVSCPRDCEMEDWSFWDPCDVSCGTGGTQRTRKVLKHPSYGGLECGALKQQKACHQGTCPVNCEVSDWSEWDDCSHSCSSNESVATKSRRRDIIQLNNAVGEACGKLNESATCSLHRCPIDCKMSDWADWSGCSTSCGAGVIERTRTVKTSSMYGGAACVDETLTFQKRMCVKDTCPVDCAWADWQDWRGCSTTCGTGNSLRMRLIQTPAMHGGMSCAGQPQQSRECNEMFCPQHCAWGPWAAVEDCSLSCGGGSHRHTRAFAATAQYGGNPCSGNSTRVFACNTEPCPIDCQWGDWADWGGCSSSCESGLRVRLRNVSVPAEYRGFPCVGNATQISACPDLPSCPVNCEWDDWSSWQGCSVTCGSGWMRRIRTRKQYEQAGGHTCFGTEDDEQVCSMQECPVDCALDDWSSWSECSTTCGVGRHSRERLALRDASGGGLPCNPSDMKAYKTCTTSPCPIDCVWGEWADWTTCTRSCDGGSSYRKRAEKVSAEFEGRPCNGATEEEQVCNPGGCPRDCKFSEWTEWSCCDKTCGGGQKQATRSVVVQPQWGGAQCEGSLERADVCNSMPCPRDCVWASWSAWALCSATCGGGEMNRSRSKMVAEEYGGKHCEGEAQESCACNSQGCPVDCKWSAWTVWSACSKSCDGGSRNRTRSIEVLKENGGDPCIGPTTELADCDGDMCPVDCAWEDWSAWGPCSATCNGGIMKRSREKKTSAINGGKPCEGNHTTTEACNNNPCPVDCTFGQWDTWSDCSTSCGVGQRFRTRVRHAELYGGTECAQNMSDVKDCTNDENLHICPNTTNQTTNRTGSHTLVETHESVSVSPSGLASWLFTAPTSSSLASSEALPPSSFSSSASSAFPNGQGGEVPASTKDTVIVSKNVKTSSQTSDDINSIRRHDNLVASVAGDFGIDVGDGVDAFLTHPNANLAMRQVLATLASSDAEDVTVELSKTTSDGKSRRKGNVNVAYLIKVEKNDLDTGNVTKIAESLSEQDVASANKVLQAKATAYSIGAAHLQAAGLSVSELPLPTKTRNDRQLDDVFDEPQAQTPQKSKIASRVLLATETDPMSEDDVAIPRQITAKDGSPAGSHAAAYFYFFVLAVALAEDMPSGPR
eukprot:TRINITY_DN41312_c0_g1_i1.p1 TRINITY_DN41312_c0_g1~~TRINITY_DN41312_c0_g1_i1.p1  ORF type:complete len:1369 (-),score=168.96 TRINITY_DN41312_c0_g1_i1:58-3600(-)